MSEKIIVYAIEGAGIGGDWLGCAFIEGKGCLCSHSCSSEGWVLHDMGITSDWKHNVYDKHCPDGWEIDYRGAITVADFNAWAVEHLPEKEDR